MRFYLVVIGAVLLWAFALSFSLVNIENNAKKGGNVVSLNSRPMQLSSSAFAHMGSIPSQYTCDGDGVNPPLNITDVPKKAESLALIMEDPDVPKSIREDGMWDHWIVWNIPVETREITEASVPPGIVGLNTSGGREYSGPCPPDREHRYFFKLYALDAILQLEGEATKKELLAAMEGHILDTAGLIGKYIKK